MKALLFNPKIISFVGHVIAVLALTVFGTGGKDLEDLAQPIPIELVMEMPGKIDESLEEEGDAEAEDLEDLELAAVAESQPETNTSQQSVEKPLLPDDLNYVDKPLPDLSVIAPKTRPTNEIQQATTVETAKDLALTKQEEHEAVFNPSGEAKPDVKTKQQSRADAGQKESNEQTPTPETEVVKARDQEASEADGEDGFILTSTGGDVPLPRFKPNTLQFADAAEFADETAEKPKLADSGIEKEIQKDTTSKDQSGDDDINTADASEAADAKKVTTPIPKPKPRALAKAMADAKVLEEKAIEQAKAEASQPLIPEETEKQEIVKKPKAEDAELTNQLNDAVLAILSEETDPEPSNDPPPEEILSSTVLPTEPLVETTPLPLPVADVASSTQADQGTSALSLLSPNEIDRIANQISNAWYIPPGTDINTVPTVTLRVELAPDGHIIDARAKDFNRYQNDQAFRFAADGAIASVRATSPWQPPQAPYETWRFFEPTFELADFIGD